jgi:hypothetical protein
VENATRLEVLTIARKSNAKKAIQIDTNKKKRFKSIPTKRAIPTKKERLGQSLASRPTDKT